MIRKLIAVGAFCALALAGVLAYASPPAEVPMFEPIPIVSEFAADLVAGDFAAMAIIALAIAAVVGIAITIARQRGGHGAANDRAGPTRYRSRRLLSDPGRSLA